MKRNRFGQYMLATLLALLTLLPACGGGEGGLHDGLGTGKKTFWAQNQIDLSYYQTPATLVGEGRHCYIYLEDGRTASRAAIDNLVSEFDDRIYPVTTAAFGSEPSPGADGDPKIFILLLEIRQRETPDNTFIAGYFDSYNEQPRDTTQVSRPFTNQKEMFFVEVVRQAVDDPFLLRTLAHEFQHMIHWEQKDHLRLNEQGRDDAWLNEAMSEAASILCYGPDDGRIQGFGDRFTQSSQFPLTFWSSDIQNYYKVAMWSQFIIDRYPDNVFRSSLQSSLVGASSVDNALVGTGKTFTDLFNEWTIANLVACGPAVLAPIVSLAGHADWTYRDIAFNDLAYPIPPTLGIVEVPPLFRWSSIYTMFSPAFGNPGQIAWTPSAFHTSAALFDLGGGIFRESMVPGQVYTYTDNAFLVFRNATPSDNATIFGDNVVFQSLTGGAPAQARLRSLPVHSDAGRSPASRGYRGYCTTPEVEERNRWIQERGLRVDF